MLWVVRDGGTARTSSYGGDCSVWPEGAEEGAVGRIQRALNLVPAGENPEV